MIVFYLYGGGIENVDSVYFWLIVDLLLVLFIGVFVVILFGVILSLFNGFLNSIIMLFILDIYKLLCKFYVDEVDFVKIGWIFVVVFGLVLIVIVFFILYVLLGLYSYF